MEPGRPTGCNTREGSRMIAERIEEAERRESAKTFADAWAAFVCSKDDIDESGGLAEVHHLDPHSRKVHAA